MYHFDVADGVARLRFDDGKANVVGHALIDAVNDALDAAQQDASALVIAGREGIFSGGFDLAEINKGPEAAMALVNRGAEMLTRVFAHPQPTVAACTGHAIAAGAFLLLACDSRIGAAGDFKIGLNETAIGMALPVFGLELATARLSRRHLTRAVTQGELYPPEAAADAGFLDAVRPAAEVVDAAAAEAARLGALPGDAYAANKLGIRRETAERIRRSFT